MNLKSWSNLIALAINKLSLIQSFVLQFTRYMYKKSSTLVYRLLPCTTSFIIRFFFCSRIIYHRTVSLTSNTQFQSHSRDLFRRRVNVSIRLCVFKLFIIAWAYSNPVRGGKRGRDRDSEGSFWLKTKVINHRSFVRSLNSRYRRDNTRNISPL